MTRSMSPETAEALKRGADRLVHEYMHQDTNVHGVGYGFRKRAGQETDEPVIVVLVAEKRPEALVSRRRLLPKTVEIDGRRWGVDVQQKSRFRTGAAVSGPPPPTGALHLARRSDPIYERMRPPLQGCSVAHEPDNIVHTDPKPGTYGCSVIDETDGTVCFLSANHVLALVNQASISDTIIQPGEIELGDVTDQDRIAFLKRYDPITKLNGTDTDAAIAQLYDQGQGWNGEIAKEPFPA